MKLLVSVRPTHSSFSFSPFSFASLSFVVLCFSDQLDFFTSNSFPFPLCSIEGYSLETFTEFEISFVVAGFCDDFLPCTEEPDATSVAEFPATAYVFDKGPDLEPGFY